MTRRRRSVLIIAGGALIVCAGCLLLAVAVYLRYGNPLDPFDNRAFSPMAWRAAAPQARARMGRSVIRRHLPTGLAEKQVVLLLGQPDTVISGTDAGGHVLAGVRTYSYRLGNWSMGGFDDAYLYVHLDSADRVVGAEINGY